MSFFTPKIIALSPDQSPSSLQPSDNQSIPLHSTSIASSLSREGMIAARAFRESSFFSPAAALSSPFSERSVDCISPSALQSEPFQDEDWLSEVLDAEEKRSSKPQADRLFFDNGSPLQFHFSSDTDPTSADEESSFEMSADIGSYSSTLLPFPGDSNYFSVQRSLSPFLQSYEPPAETTVLDRVFSPPTAGQLIMQRRRRMEMENYHRVVTEGRRRSPKDGDRTPSPLQNSDTIPNTPDQPEGPSASRI